MRAYVVYDSWYGDTRRIAQEIARGIAERTGTDPAVVEVDHAAPPLAASADLLVVGTPNHFGGPTRKVRQFVRDLRVSGTLRGTLAVFDTCFEGEAGKAAHKLALLLVELQGHEGTAPSEISTLVEGTRGPLRSGELERAHVFGAELARAIRRVPVVVAA